ncbi:MAG TPA: molybdopterin-dependent oxidoreductase [Longimicrobiales bacterium]
MMSTVDRRTFLKDMAAVSAAAAGVVLVPEAAAAGTAARARAQAVTWRKAPCSLCSVGCGLLVGTRDGRAIAVKGDAESPVSRGLACVKGYHSVQALYGRDRITRARIRRDGRLVDAPVREALDLVARRLREIREQYGRDSVAVYGSAQWTVADRYIAGKLFRGALGTGHIESDTRLESGSGAAGLLATFGMDGAAGCYDDIEHADVFVLWNHNIAESDPVLFSRMLERRRRNPGVRIVDVGTRTTRTSYAADRALLYIPRTELALANAIAREIVSHDRVNREFLRRYVSFRRGSEEIGFGTGDAGLVADTAEAVDFDDYARFLEAYAAERVERIAGMAAADIRWLASLYSDPARRVMSLWGADVSRHARGTWVNNAISNIHLLVGKVAAPGNAALCTSAGADACTAVECGGPLATAPAAAAPITSAQRDMAAALWRMPAATISTRAAPGPLAMFRALESGDVRFLWIQGADPLTSLPNLERYRAAAALPDRFLVVSDAYPTPTTDIADVVLPAALWVEREGVCVNAERRMQHFEQMVDPPGEAMDAAWQMIEVARRLGLTAHFPWPRGPHIEAGWAEYTRFHAAASRRLPPLARLRTGTGARWPYVGGVEADRRYAAGADPNADPQRGEFDFYGHDDHRAWIWLRPHEPAVETPDRDYPFWLAIGRVLEHGVSGTLTRRIDTLHRAMPGAFVELNAQDAAALGIRDGDRVRLSSRRGRLELQARVDHRSQPARGTVFVPDFDETVPVNVLTVDASCPLSGQPDGTCAVRVERVAPRSAT